MNTSDKPGLLEWLDLHLEETICVIALIGLSCMMMLQIILRYVFKAGLPWAEEFCRYCFVYAALIGMGYVIRRNKNLRVDIIIGLLPGKMGKVADLFREIVSVVFYVMMIYASWLATMKLRSLNQVSPAMQIPIWTIYMAGPIGFTLATFRTLQRIVNLLRHFNDKEDKKA